MKIAISVPDEVFEEAERASKRLRQSRSRFYTRAVEHYLKEIGGDEITERLNSVFKDQPSRLDPVMEGLSLEVLRGEEW